MARKPKYEPNEEAKKFVREDKVIIDGFEVLRGDTIKVKGEHGGKFKFDHFVTNAKTGATWVECFELHRGQTGCYRAFHVENIKRVPKKRGRSKRVVV
jgi:hypothetical protein